MQNKLFPTLAICAILLLPPLFSARVQAAGASTVQTVSPNIPLDSYIYTYLAKLDGLGYLEAMLPDAKPYDRRRAAGWVRQMLEKTATLSVPDYAQAMLDRLKREFVRELADWETGNHPQGVRLAEVTWENASYDGQSLSYPALINAVYQPLNINNNGYRFGEGFNSVFTMRWEGGLSDSWVISATPRFSYDDAEDFSASLESGYLKTHWRNLVIQLGKDALWWGPGERGNLGLTNNATPFTALQLGNLDPIICDGMFSWLRQLDVKAFYADLEKERSDVKSPGFYGVRLAATPTANLTVAGTLNAMAGGVGRELHLSDLEDFLTGKNAETSTSDKWNTIAGWDFRWRVPRCNGWQLYGELYGEDQAGKIIPWPSKNAYLAGLLIPRLTADGRWDLRLETAKTTNVWYVHGLYKNGYTYKGDLIGDAMGCNATRYYLRLSRYLTLSSRLVLNAANLTMDRDAAYPQRVNSFWVTYQRELRSDWTVSVTAGVADIENFNYQADRSEKKWLVDVGLSKRF
jgi:hypothetical protein